MNTSSGSITLKKLLESEQINKFIINGTDHAINGQPPRTKVRGLMVILLNLTKNQTN